MKLEAEATANQAHACKTDITVKKCVYSQDERTEHMGVKDWKDRRTAICVRIIAAWTSRAAAGGGEWRNRWQRERGTKKRTMCLNTKGVTSMNAMVMNIMKATAMNIMKATAMNIMNIMNAMAMITEAIVSGREKLTISFD